jgi:hypothetical protein
MVSKGTEVYSGSMDCMNCFPLPTNKLQRPLWATVSGCAGYVKAPGAA